MRVGRDGDLRQAVHGRHMGVGTARGDSSLRRVTRGDVLTRLGGAQSERICRPQDAYVALTIQVRRGVEGGLFLSSGHSWGSCVWTLPRKCPVFILPACAGPEPSGSEGCS